MHIRQPPFAISQAYYLQCLVLIVTMFNTKSMNVVSECLDMFNVLSVADYIVKRKCNFLTGYINSQNSLCNLLCSTAKFVFKIMFS